MCGRSLCSVIQLYERFPVRTRIDFNFVPEELFDDTDEITDVLQKHVVFGESVRWLEKAGYVWIGGISSQEAVEVVLTPKALELLKAVPESLTTRETVGELLVRGVREGAKDSVKSAVTFALAKGFALTLGQF